MGRKGNDLYTGVLLDLNNAVRAKKGVIDTIHGKIELNVASETQNDSKTRLKSKGNYLQKRGNICGSLSDLRGKNSDVSI